MLSFSEGRQEMETLTVLSLGSFNQKNKILLSACDEMCNKRDDIWTYVCYSWLKTEQTSLVSLGMMYLQLNWFWSFHLSHPEAALSVLSSCMEYDAWYLQLMLESHS